MPYMFLIIAAALAVSNLVQKISYSPDDTYIYLQYARNLATGSGFSFNAGEPSYGITSPVWALMLAPGFWLTADAYWYAKILDLCFLFLSAFMFYKVSGLVYKRNFEAPAIAKALQLLSLSVFLLNSWLLRWSFTGMETSFAVFLVLFIFCCLYNSRFVIAFALLGIMFFVRPESIVLSALCFVFMLIKKPGIKKIIISSLVFAAILGAFFLYAKSAFGTIFPNTTLGKATFSFGFSIYFAEIKRIVQTIALSSLIEFIFCFGFVYYLLKYRKWNEDLLLIIWPLALVFLYVVTDADIISRYLLIIIPFITIAGISVLGRAGRSLVWTSFVVFLVVLIQSQLVFYTYVKPHTDNFSYGVNHCFMDIADWLKKNTSPGSKVLVNDVGAIGYYSGRYIIDAAALVNRDIELNKKIMKTPVEERGVTANLLKFIDADYLVERDVSMLNELNTMGKYKLEFISVKEFPSLGISDPNPTYYKIYKVIPIK